MLLGLGIGILIQIRRSSVPTSWQRCGFTHGLVIVRGFSI